VHLCVFCIVFVRVTNRDKNAHKTNLKKKVTTKNSSTRRIPLKELAPSSIIHHTSTKSPVKQQPQSTIYFLFCLLNKSVSLLLRLLLYYYLSVVRSYYNCTSLYYLFICARERKRILLQPSQQNKTTI
jgi:hypothetical protein